MDSTQEELLLALMSMGFEYDNCMKVIKDGVYALDDAVQRLVNPDQAVNASQPSTSATLSLPPQTQSSSSIADTVEESEHGKIKSRFERQRKEQAEYERQEFKASEIQRKKQRTEERKLKQNLLKDIASDRQHSKHGESTSSMDDVERKKKEKEEYERKQKEMHAEKWKQMEKEKRQEKQRIRAAIEEDKQNKKKQREELDKPKNISTTTTMPLQSHSRSPEKNTTCRIQVNFPNNTHQVYTLPSGSPLQELYNLCQDGLGEEVSGLNHAFVQTFPRRKLTSDEFSKSFRELGLCPSCRLIIQKDVETRPSSVPEPEMSSGIEASSSMITEGGSSTPEIDDGGKNRVRSPALKRPCIESRLLQGSIDNQIDDFVQEMDEGANGDQQGNGSDIANSNVIEEAIRKRLDNKTSEHMDFGSSRKMTSLQKLVAVYVATQLIKKQADIVEHIGLLNPTAADFIVRALQRSNNLTIDLLNILQPCKLKEINFDFCRLAPLDVIYALKLHQNLRKISLKSVTCVSDRVVETLVKNIHRLSYLNLSDCDGVIGSFLTSPHGLSRLKTLILNRTKVKDEYIRSFLRLEIAKDLNELSLNKCSITNNAFNVEKDFPSIKALSIDETKVDSLSYLKYFTNICSLSLRKTNIKNDDMVFVGSLKNLKALELQSTNITYEGLLHIQDKELIRFSLPDRLGVNNQCISVIEGFNLTSLDLTNFNHLDDGCIPSLCKMKSLRHLYLSQILKLTDSGILQLKGLRDLETLNLRNTNITSRIGPLFTFLPLLHTLDVAGTKIDNDIIPSLSACLNIVKLNMSHTGIDNEGIIGLQLPRLNTLTLDGTEVTSEIVNRVVLKCPMLSWLRNASKNVLYTL